MNTIQLQDLNFLDIGHKIQLYGAIYSGNGKMYFLPLPDEDPNEMLNANSNCGWALGKAEMLVMDPAEWELFLRQTDVLDIQGPAKAILRKSQRHIDQAMAWRVYERDGYRCRYCGRKAALTVDHIIPWEENGATVEDNLAASCRRCNKLRGNMPFDKWLESEEYRQSSKNVQPCYQVANLRVRDRLPELQGLKVEKQRSR